MPGILFGIAAGATIFAAGFQPACAAIGDEGIFRRLERIGCLFSAFALRRDGGFGNRCFAINPRRTFSTLSAVIAFRTIPLAVFARTLITRPVVTGAILTGAIFTRPVFLRAAILRTIVLTRLFTAFFAFFAFAAGAVRRRLLVTGIFSLCAKFASIFAVFTRGRTLATFLPAFIAAGTLFFLTHAGIGQNAKIVIGELKEIFLLHTVTIQVRVVGQLAVLFQQLRRIAPRTTVNAVDLLTTAALPVTITVAVVVPTATAVVIVVTTIVIQG
jgi:hypothetical protein